MDTCDRGHLRPCTPDGRAHPVPPVPGQTRAVDIGQVLRSAREAALLSQRELAARAGTSRAAVQAYERGRVSPTVRTVDRLLAAMDLQQRISLEPLLADLDARVDQLLQPVEPDEYDRWSALARSFAEHGAHWAVDGPSALRMHGLNADDARSTWVVLVLEESRRWLARVFARGPGGRVVGWWDADLDDARWCLEGEATTMVGMLRVRVVEDLPPLLQVQPDGVPAVLPVVTVDAVEQAFPALAETLARWRQRRGEPSPTRRARGAV